MLCPDQSPSLPCLGGSVWQIRQESADLCSGFGFRGATVTPGLTELLNSSGFVQSCAEMKATLAISDFFS
jgi:hypothetical protein